jgi:glycosyltransferase involved in cell wall biosynthesis
MNLFFKQLHAYKPEVRAIFTGSRSDIPQVISAMYICVLATHAEGCPNALMEYMAAGKPVMSSNVGGCKGPPH